MIGAFAFSYASRSECEVALQALQTAERSGAPGGVIQKLQDALTAASQSYGAALQGLAAANATVDQLEAAANSLQQDLNQG